MGIEMVAGDEEEGFSLFLLLLFIRFFFLLRYGWSRDGVYLVGGEESGKEIWRENGTRRGRVTGVDEERKIGVRVIMRQTDQIDSREVV